MKRILCFLLCLPLILFAFGCDGGNTSDEVSSEPPAESSGPSPEITETDPATEVPADTDPATDAPTEAPETEGETEPTYVAVDDPTRRDGAEIRVMSWNVLYESTDYPVEPRARYAADAILYYAPDVIGTQETSPGWYRELSANLPQYRYVTSVDETGGDNYATLWYNTETVKLLDWGVLNYNAAAVKRMRIVTWGVFERLDGGERFIVTSTHWDRDVESENGISITRQANELSELLGEIRAEHPYPTFCTGDYNRTPATPQYKLFLKLTGFFDASYEAEYIHREVPTYHAVGSGNLSVGSIDHIFCSPEARVLLYNVLIDPTVLDASDHCPIYIDADLSEG